MSGQRGLLDDITAEEIETLFLAQEEKALAAREYGICVILDRLTNDEELRRRVRAHLRQLPSERKPGPNPVLPDLVVYHIVEAGKEAGFSMAKSFKLLSRPGLTQDSVKTKYKRGKIKAAAKRGTEK